MAQKAATRKAAPKKTTDSGRKIAAPTAGFLLESDHAEAAYYHWLDRGAPLWDDQYDWFAATKKT